MGEIKLNTEDLLKFVATTTGAKLKDLTATVEELEDINLDSVTDAIKPVIAKHSKEVIGLHSRKGYQKAERTLKEALPFVDFQTNKLDDMVEELKEFASNTKEQPKTEEFTLAKALKVKGVKEHFENHYKELESNVESRIRTEQELDNYLLSQFNEVGVQFPKTEDARKRAERRQLEILKEQFKFKKDEKGFTPIDKDGNPLYDDSSKAFLDISAVIQKTSLYDIGVESQQVATPSNIPVPPANKAGVGNNFGYTKEEAQSLRYSDYISAKNSGDHEKAAFIEKVIESK